MTLKPGLYFLQNLMSGTYLDLRKDRKGVDGFAYYGGIDQQWEIGKLGNRGWFIRSCYSANDHYLTVETALGHCAEIAVNGFPTAWVFEHEPKLGENVYWIHWPNSVYSIDLYGGERNDGTKVFLYNKQDSDTRQQFWKLTRCPEKDRASTAVIEDDEAEATVTTTVITTTTKTTTKTIAKKKESAEVEDKAAVGTQTLEEEQSVIEEPLQD